MIAAKRKKLSMQNSASYTNSDASYLIAIDYNDTQPNYTEAEAHGILSMRYKSRHKNSFLLTEWHQVPSLFNPSKRSWSSVSWTIASTSISQIFPTRRNESFVSQFTHVVHTYRRKRERN